MRPNAASSTPDIMRQRLRKLRYQIIYANIFAIFWCVSALPAHSDSIDSRAYVEKAVELIQAQQWSLARTYLAPALIDPRLGAGERSRAYYLQGYSYYAQGLPVSASKDYARALEFNPENGAALVGLGGLYHRGEGVPEDAELAFAFFDSAAEAGHPEGDLFVGYALLEGLGVEKNIGRARERLKALADEGDATAMLYMGRSLPPGNHRPGRSGTSAPLVRKRCGRRFHRRPGRPRLHALQG